MATITDIARAAGVSTAVISRVVNEDPSLRIRETTRQRVLDAVRRHDYAPNAAAKSLRTAQTDLLALVVHDLSNPLHAEIAAGARREAERSGKSLLLGEAREMGDGPGRLEELVAGGGVDGLILQGEGSDLDRALERAAPGWMPTVLLQSGSPKGHATLVRLEDEKAGRLATERLLELGHRRIGFLGVASGQPFSDDRRRGWENALRAAGIEPRESWFGDAGSSYAAGREAADELLRSARGVTALAVANVASAIGALSLIADRGLRVPEDLSLIAVHDTAAAEYVRPALTTVRMPLAELGAAAVRACCQRAGTEPRLRRVSEPEPEIVDRGSVAVPA